MIMSDGGNSILDSIKSALFPIHPAGWPFIAVFAVVAVVLGFFSDTLGWIGLIATAWCAYFFRDPARVTPLRDGLIVSPADGVVQMITRAVPPAELGLGPDPMDRISVFLSVFDVHVNRMPASGTVKRVEYRPGAFLNASLDKASQDNERSAIFLELEDEAPLVVVQIAGLVARRIKTDVRAGQTIRAGERFGIIRFGSRTDVYLPEGSTILAIEGQRMIGGETVIADRNTKESQRVGEKS